jgi:cell division septum initiation protein DivIVA
VQNRTELEKQDTQIYIFQQQSKDLQQQIKELQQQISNIILIKNSMKISMKNYHPKMKKFII